MNQCPRWSRGRGLAPYPREPTVRRLTLFFCRKKANIRKKITANVSGQSELRISIYTRNGETEPEQNAEPERNRERQRDKSNRGGALSPPMPWRPRTRGETLLPSREEVKEEEGEGALSPSLPVAPERRRGHHRVTAI